jgi:HEPN domain-containing protein
LNRKDFQLLSNVRLKEAKALLGVGLYNGAYYLAGYAVECGLKACIAKRTLRYDFPDRDVQGLYTHAPRKLLEKAGLAAELEAHVARDLLFRMNRDIVGRWSPESRYNVHSREDAGALVSAVGERPHGVMLWIKRYW